MSDLANDVPEDYPKEEPERFFHIWASDGQGPR